MTTVNGLYRSAGVAQLAEREELGSDIKILEKRSSTRAIKIGFLVNAIWRGR